MHRRHALHITIVLSKAAVPITKLFAWGEGESGGHVLRETTSVILDIWVAEFFAASRSPLRKFEPSADVVDTWLSSNANSPVVSVAKSNAVCRFATPPCLSSAKLRSTDSVNPRAVLSRVLPRYRHLL